MWRAHFNHLTNLGRLINIFGVLAELAYELGVA